MVEQILNLVNRVSDTPKRIVVAMSGGVDSSTVAAVLKAFGHEIIGVTLQLYDYGLTVGKKGACCAGQDIYDASIAAEKIGIPHYVLNYESIFKQAVIDDFADSYLKGETPIPCVRCNQNVKFKDLFKVAKDLQADFLATGHYVRKEIRNGQAQLHSGAEFSKDQSYFLFTTTKEQLDFLEFPLGALNKTQTRELARYFDLPVSDKPDSQDICFVPNGNYGSVIEKYRPGALDPGELVLKDGTVLGKHDGIINFTIGQRRGIGIAHEKPLYVIKIEPETNRVIVGYEEDLYSNSLTIKEVNWLIDEIQPGKDIRCQVKLRSSHALIDATITSQDDSKATVTLDTPYKGITPGQACVMYDGSRILGGGWICA